MPLPAYPPLPAAALLPTPEEPFPFPPGPPMFYHQLQMMPFPFGLAMAAPVRPGTFTSSPTNFSLSSGSFTFTPSTNTPSMNVLQQPQTSLNPDNPLIGTTNSSFDEIDPDRSRSCASGLTSLPRIDEVIEDVDPNSVVVPFRILVDATMNTELTHTDILYTSRDDLVGGTLRKASPENHLLSLPPTTLISEGSREQNKEPLESTQAEQAKSDAGVDTPSQSKIATSQTSQEEVKETEEENEDARSRMQSVDSLEAIAINENEEEGEPGDPDKGLCSVM